MNLYELLDIPRDASSKQVRKAYHRTALKYHPDKQAQTSPEVQSMFLRVVEAFTVLSNDTLRAAYDKDLAIKDGISQASQERQAMIADLESRSVQSAASDPLDVYRKDLRESLRKFRPNRDTIDFPEYRRIILSALTKSG
jgi:DnaJ-class molecular chaperone